jgi:hypothetical protein
MSGATLKVTDKDAGWDALKERVLKLSTGGAFTLVGVQGQQAAAAHHKAARMTVADLAVVHEFGAVIRTRHGSEIVIPQRSFIRATIDEYAPKLQRTASALGQGVLMGKFMTRQALELLGQQGTGLIKQRIADRIAPRNADSTIARKKSSTPLVDTGQLRGSITHRVEGG